MMQIPAPRLVAHVSLSVSDWKAALAFYRDVCGLGEVGRIDRTGAVFLSSGFNHHEIELFERPSAAFNHVGIEMNSEADLVALWDRLGRSGFAVERAVSVGAFARGLFTRDPDGNGLHFIANLERNWEPYWHQLAEIAELPWHRAGANAPCAESRYARGLPIIRSGKAVFRPIHLAGVTLNVSDLWASIRYYCDVVGMQMADLDRDARRAILAGTDARGPLTLLSDPGRDLGLCCLSLAVASGSELEQGLSTLPSAMRRGGQMLSQHSCLLDPDRFVVELRVVAS